MTGEVFDSSDGQSIVGATVKVDGSNKVAVTDLDGRFSFSNLTASETKITVTYVGYETVTADIKPDMKIYLDPKTEMMDEVIVVAFGKQKREAFTGSASVVSGDEISMSQVSSPIDALSGRVSGMMMTDNNNPASSSSASQIVIRGIGSINAGTSPLIVLDGLPYSGRMNDINPSDIENITVLKDAASNALYGARGANGVIMITTKSASRGTTKVTVGAKWGVNSDARVHYDYIDNPGEYYEAFYMGLMNDYRYKQGMSFQEAHILANNTLGLPDSQNGLGYMVYSVPENQFLIGENGTLNPNATLGNRVAYNN
ncbi:MAG: TonB-dependent receptor plug domain-containing protein, partial [Duncaniella sp.]|nr:TonB-dependent receptor plug domain-containing protein [Duncaniella sp.]